MKIWRDLNAVHSMSIIQRFVESSSFSECATERASEDLKGIKNSTLLTVRSTVSICKA